MSGIKSKEIHLASRPNGMPTKDNFKLAEVEMRAIKDGEILIKNHWMSVDPYMRGRKSGPISHKGAQTRPPAYRRVKPSDDRQQKQDDTAHRGYGRRRLWHLSRAQICGP